MAKIIKILHFQDKDEYALVEVRLDDGTEGTVYVGGDVKVFLHRGKIKVVVKRALKIMLDITYR
jgi:hypothetical protein